MDIRINSVRFDHSDKLGEFINKKVKKLDKYYDGIISAEISLKVIKPETAINKQVNLILNIPNNELFAEKVADSFEEGVDLALDAIKKQLQKYKEKLKR